MSNQMSGKAITPEREEIKAYTISCLLAGDSYQETRWKCAERYKYEPGIGTLHRWFHADPAFDQWAADQMRAMLDQNFRIRSKATSILDERLNEEPDTYKLNAVKGTAEDKIIAMARLSQDQKHSNLLADALKHALRQPHHTLITSAATITEDDA